jgi:glycosyltransferase involved in cell wall biosynthesis
MAMGVPVVSSEIAAGGIDAVPGEHFLTASRPQEYADALLRLMTDAQARAQFSQAGRARVLSNHDWKASMRRLDALIADCMAVTCG